MSPASRGGSQAPEHKARGGRTASDREDTGRTRETEGAAGLTTGRQERRRSRVRHSQGEGNVEIPSTLRRPGY